MTGLFEDISLFDDRQRLAGRKAAAVAQKRVADQVGAYLKIAKTREEYEARLSFVREDIRQIVADVAEEYGADQERLLEAIDEHLKGDGVTDLNGELDDAPSAVGHGKQAAGHKPGCDCGFCRNKGKLPGSDKDKDESDPDLDDSDSDADDPEVKESATKEASEFGHLGLHRNEEGHALATPANMAAIEQERARQGGTQYGSPIVVAHSPYTGEEYSATSGDYFAQAPDQPLTDSEGNPMILGRPYSGIEPLSSVRIAGLEYDLDGFIWATVGGEKMGPFNSEEEANQAIIEAEAEQLQRHADPSVNPGEQPPGYDPRQGAFHQAEAPRDGGGAVKTESLPKGDGKAVGTGASPEIDKKKWKPTALNPSGNLPPVDTEMKGSPNPTVEQDVIDEKADYKGDFLRDTDAVVDKQDVTQGEELSHDGQGGSWSGTEGQADPVTSSVDPDVNPLKAILDSGFAAPNQVESAIHEYESTPRPGDPVPGSCGVCGSPLVMSQKGIAACEGGCTYGMDALSRGKDLRDVTFGRPA